VSEVEDLKRLANAKGLSLLASWHSRHAPAVEDARAFLAATEVRHAVIRWKEDVRRWHPGQEWIWEAGGFGVFDPGINALSIATHIFPQCLFLIAASLGFPSNRDAPIAARLSLRGSAGLPLEAEFDWRQSGPQTWDILAETAAGSMLLSGGGARLAVDGKTVSNAPEAEYRMLYARFAEMVRAETSDVDLAPLQLVADAFMVGRREILEPFAG
jgi:D-galactose 1-dehydrogenase